LFPAAADVAPATTKLPFTHLHSITTGPDDMALFCYLLCLLSMLMITGAFYVDDAYVRVAFGENKHACYAMLCYAS
jgi:hypothetical protein